MDVICDIETDGLSATKIHVIVCKDIKDGTVYTFYPTRPSEVEAFRVFASNVRLWVGHHFLGFDAIQLRRLLGVDIPYQSVCDTYVVSLLLDQDIDGGHSLEAWGERLGRPKLHTDITDWSTLTPELEERCKGDVETNYLLYHKFLPYVQSKKWASALETEHFIANLCHTCLSTNGFAFDYSTAVSLKSTIDEELRILDKELKEVFLPKVTLVREVVPRVTTHGTIAKNSIPKVLGNDYTSYSPGAPFSLIEYVSFNARSHKQRLDRLWDAGWKPENKSKGHIVAEKALHQLKRKRRHSPTDQQERTAVQASLGEYGVSGYGRYGWKTDEENLNTLPDTPEAVPAKKLARFLLLSSRSSTLNTWMEAYHPDTGRIHGSFNHIGAWTGRMSHDRPNMGNIPKFDSKQPEKTPYSDQMRSLWVSSKARYLVGVDAESIQLRIFGHYIEDDEFIKALCEGTKEDETDPHSVNRRALGSPCKSRDDAKTFIYAFLLGAGVGKVSAILGCTREEAQEAVENFLDRYQGLKYLKNKVIPIDAERGYFQGFDGRYVKIWGEDARSRAHFTLAGYLQNGEAVIMKRAVQLWYPKLVKEGVPFWWVNFVHDEWQTETPEDMEIARYVAQSQADAIQQVGLDLGLRCPLAGSILNAHGKLAIGHNWMETH
jgi:DNA polymerase-1